MGKYTGLIEGLPRLPPSSGEEDQDEKNFQHRVDGEKQRIVTELNEGGRKPSTEEVVALYTAARQEKDEINKSLSTVNLKIIALEQLMETCFDHDRITKHYLPDGTNVALQLEPTVVVKDKEAYRQWCISRGLEHEMHLWPSKTASIVKQRLVEGEPAPPGVELYVLGKFVLRKA